MEILIYIAAAICAVIAFHFFDAWHRRRARRDAERWAREYMERRHDL